MSISVLISCQVKSYCFHRLLQRHEVLRASPCMRLFVREHRYCCLSSGVMHDQLWLTQQCYLPRVPEYSFRVRICCFFQACMDNGELSLGNDQIFCTAWYTHLRRQSEPFVDESLICWTLCSLGGRGVRGCCP